MFFFLFNKLQNCNLNCKTVWSQCYWIATEFGRVEYGFGFCRVRRKPRFVVEKSRSVVFAVESSPLGRQRVPARETSGNATRWRQRRIRLPRSDSRRNKTRFPARRSRSSFFFFFFCTICCITIVRIIIRYKRARNRHVTRNNARPVDTARPVLSRERHPVRGHPVMAHSDRRERSLGPSPAAAAVVRSYVGPVE